MKMLPFLMYVVLPIIGLVVGATLQYWFTRVLEERRHKRNLKTQAYLDAIRNFMDAYFKGEKEEFMSGLADAKARIAIYGSKEVVEAFANANRKRKVPEEFKNAFIEMVQAMRKDNLPEESVPNKEISQLLFGGD